MKNIISRLSDKIKDIKMQKDRVYITIDFDFDISQQDINELMKSSYKLVDFEISRLFDIYSFVTFFSANKNVFIPIWNKLTNTNNSLNDFSSLSKGLQEETIYTICDHLIEFELKKFIGLKISKDGLIIEESNEY